MRITFGTISETWFSGRRDCVYHGHEYHSPEYHGPEYHGHEYHGHEYQSAGETRGRVCSTLEGGVLGITFGTISETWFSGRRDCVYHGHEYHSPEYHGHEYHSHVYDQPDPTRRPSFGLRRAGNATGPEPFDTQTRPAIGGPPPSGGRFLRPAGQSVSQPARPRTRGPRAAADRQRDRDAPSASAVLRRTSAAAGGPPRSAGGPPNSAAGQLRPNTTFLKSKPKTPPRGDLPPHPASALPPPSGGERPPSCKHPAGVCRGWRRWRWRRRRRRRQQQQQQD